MTFELIGRIGLADDPIEAIGPDDRCRSVVKSTWPRGGREHVHRLLATGCADVFASTASVGRIGGAVDSQCTEVF